MMNKKEAYTHIYNIMHKPVKGITINELWFFDHTM